MLSNHSIKVIDIPFLPREIDAAILDERGLLASGEELSKVSSIQTTSAKCHKLSKKTYQLKHALITTPGALFAISGKQGTAGKGNEGKVKWVQNTHTGTWSAMKVQASKNSLWGNDISYLDRIGELVKENDEHVKFQYRGKRSVIKKCFLMQGKPGISLYDYINEKVNNNLILNLKIIANIIAACQRLKDQDIFHGDIKLENIMLDPANAEIALIDYGFSENLDANKQFEKIPKELKGTAKYLAPEILIRYKDIALTNSTFAQLITMLHLNLSEKVNTLSPEQVTMYSIGIIAAELLNFMDLDNLPSLNRAGNIAYLSMDTTMLDQLVDFVLNMININPGMRPSYQMATSFFSDFSSKLKDANNASPLSEL
ncbi:MAG: protein kinase [Gammaproteobacteria bacterium]